MSFCPAKIVQTLMDRFRTFSIADVAVFKVCLIAFGVLLGLNGRAILKPLQPMITGALAGAYVFLIFRLWVVPKLEDTDQPML